jgi:hypothetical protein
LEAIFQSTRHNWIILWEKKVIEKMVVTSGLPTVGLPKICWLDKVMHHCHETPKECFQYMTFHEIYFFKWSPVWLSNSKRFEYYFDMPSTFLSCLVIEQFNVSLSRVDVFNKIINTLNNLKYKPYKQTPFCNLVFSKI